MSENSIDVDRYEVRPPRWVLWSAALVIGIIYLTLVFAPSGNGYVKWPIVAGVTVVLIGVLNNVRKYNYLTTLVADARGLYFYLYEPKKYYYISWAEIGQIKQGTFGVYTRGLAIKYIGESVEEVSQKLGNIRQEGKDWYIYTIPQLQIRDDVIKHLNRFRNLSGC